MVDENKRAKNIAERFQYNLPADTCERKGKRERMKPKKKSQKREELNLTFEIDR